MAIRFWYFLKIPFLMNSKSPNYGRDMRFMQGDSLPHFSLMDGEAETDMARK